MSHRLVPDDLWEAIEPLLPRHRPKPQGGRPRVSDRAALGGIIFVLRTGMPWRLPPRELGCGSGVTCWRPLRDWQQADVWEALHRQVLNWLGEEQTIDCSRASIDSLSVRAKRRRGDRSEPRGPRQARQQVPPARGSPRHPARGHTLGRQRPRLGLLGAHRRRHPAHLRPAGQAGQASIPSEQTARGQGLRRPGEIEASASCSVRQCTTTNHSPSSPLASSRPMKPGCCGRYSRRTGSFSRRKVCSSTPAASLNRTISMTAMLLA